MRDKGKLLPALVFWRYSPMVRILDFQFRDGSSILPSVTVYNVIGEKDRYQYQSWYIKLWRRRYYLTIPFTALSIWVRVGERFRFAWSISIGLAQSKMNWLYDWEEVRGRLEKKIKPR